MSEIQLLADNKFAISRAEEALALSTAATASVESILGLMFEADSIASTVGAHYNQAVQLSEEAVDEAEACSNHRDGVAAES